MGMPITEQEKAELSDEQKKEYKKKGEEYQKLQYDITKQIARLDTEKSKLEKQLKDSLPRTPHGRLICKTCNVKSMAYKGRTPRGGLSGGQEIYECEICGKGWIGDTFF